MHLFNVRNVTFKSCTMTSVTLCADALQMLLSETLVQVHANFDPHPFGGQLDEEVLQVKGKSK